MNPSRRQSPYRSQHLGRDHSPPRDIAWGLITFCALLASPECVSSQQVTGRLVPELRIQIPEDLGLSQIGAMAEGPHGELYLTDRGEARVIVVDTKGRLARMVGRRGEGPGEFRFVGSLGWMGDSLWVSDPAMRRLSFFGADGEYLRSLPFPVLRPRRPGLELSTEAILGDGSLLIRENWGVSDASFVAATGLLVLRATRAGRITDTVRWLAARRGAMVVRLPTGGIMQRDQPWSDDDLHAIDPRGTEFIVVERPTAESPASARFRLLVYGTDGRLRFERSVPYDPVALTGSRFDAEVQRAAAPILRRFSSAGHAKDAVALEFFRPRFLPPVRNLLVGRDQSIWINVQRKESDETWLVFDKTGTLTGTILAPPQVRLLAVSSTGAWGIELDPNDLPIPVRYRIER